MLDKDKVKVKLAASQLRMAQKTMKPFDNGQPLEQCDTKMSDKVIWANMYLKNALAYLEEVIANV